MIVGLSGEPAKGMSKEEHRDRLQDAYQSLEKIRKRRVAHFRELRPPPWSDSKSGWKGPGKEDRQEWKGRERMYLFSDTDYCTLRAHIVSLLRDFVEEHVEGDTYRRQIEAILTELRFTRYYPSKVPPGGMGGPSVHQRRLICEALGCSYEYLKRFRIERDEEGEEEVVHTGGSGDSSKGARGKAPRAGPSNSVKSKVLDRDDHECVRCGSADALEVHHILPMAGNTGLRASTLNKPDNLATLCESCHRAAHLERRPTGVRRGEDLAYRDKDEFRMWARDSERYAARVALEEADDVDGAVADRLLDRYETLDGLLGVDVAEMVDLPGMTADTADSIKSALANPPAWIVRYVLEEEPTFKPYDIQQN